MKQRAERPARALQRGGSLFGTFVILFFAIIIGIVFYPNKDENNTAAPAVPGEESAVDAPVAKVRVRLAEPRKVVRAEESSAVLQSDSAGEQNPRSELFKRANGLAYSLYPMEPFLEGLGYFLPEKECFIGWYGKSCIALAENKIAADVLAEMPPQFWEAFPDEKAALEANPGAEIGDLVGRTNPEDYERIWETDGAQKAYGEIAEWKTLQHFVVAYRAREAYRFDSFQSGKNLADELRGITITGKLPLEFWQAIDTLTDEISKDVDGERSRRIMKSPSEKTAVDILMRFERELADFALWEVGDHIASSRRYSFLSGVTRNLH